MAGSDKPTKPGEAAAALLQHDATAPALDKQGEKAQSTAKLKGSPPARPAASGSATAGLEAPEDDSEKSMPEGPTTTNASTSETTSTSEAESPSSSTVQSKPKRSKTEKRIDRALKKMGGAVGAEKKRTIKDQWLAREEAKKEENSKVRLAMLAVEERAERYRLHRAIAQRLYAIYHHMTCPCESTLFVTCATSCAVVVKVG